jgi:hypothetical protein
MPSSTARPSSSPATAADRLKAALRDNPADAGFADDLERIHSELGSTFGNEVRGWPGE